MNPDCIDFEEEFLDFSESALYPQTMINGKSYYIPNPANAIIAGFFKLEDEGTLFKVTGYHKSIQPMCLKFEKWNLGHEKASDISSLYEIDDIPLAKLVSPVSIPDFIDEIEFKI